MWRQGQLVAGIVGQDRRLRGPELVELGFQKADLGRQSEAGDGLGDHLQVDAVGVGLLGVVQHIDR